jgi:hypothetical protein
VHASYKIRDNISGDPDSKSLWPHGGRRELRSDMQDPTLELIPLYDFLFKILFPLVPRLKLFENRILWRILAPKRDEVTGV